jgi:hypothetical protein
MQINLIESLNPRVYRRCLTPLVWFVICFYWFELFSMKTSFLYIGMKSSAVFAGFTGVPPVYIRGSGSFQNLQSTISEITRLLIYFAQHQSGSMHRFWWRLWQTWWRIPNTASRLKVLVKKSHPLISLLPPTGQQPIKFGVSNRRQLQWLIKIHSWDFWKWAWRTTAWCILTYSNLKSSLQSLQCTDWISGIRKSWWVHFCL